MDLETLTNQDFKPFIKNQSDYLTKISKSLQRQAAISEVYEKTTLPNMPELNHLKMLKDKELADRQMQKY